MYSVNTFIKHRFNFHDNSNIVLYLFHIMIVLHLLTRLDLIELGSTDTTAVIWSRYWKRSIVPGYFTIETKSFESKILIIRKPIYMNSKYIFITSSEGERNKTINLDRKGNLFLFNSQTEYWSDVHFICDLIISISFFFLKWSAKQQHVT